jgi:hypothetical protein
MICFCPLMLTLNAYNIGQQSRTVRGILHH